MSDIQTPTGDQDPADGDAVPFLVTTYILEERKTFAGVRDRVGAIEEEVTHSFQKVRADWNDMMGRVAALVSGADGASSQTFLLDEVQIKLGFSAKGRLAFIAEAGAEASVVLTFKRMGPAES